jgi:hypothetical protein
LFCTLYGDGNRLLGSIGASGVSDHWNDNASCGATDSAAVGVVFSDFSDFAKNPGYARGDHRHQVFAHRDEPRKVMARHDGHLPDHAIAAHGADGHPSEAPGGAQVNHAALA